MVDTPTGETVPPVTPSEAPSPAPAAPAPAPAAPVADAGEVAKLQREQIEMRANQIANEKIAAATKALEDEARAKELAAQNEFKTLYESAQEKLNKIEVERVAKEKADEAKAEADTIFAEYSPEVKKLAETAGLTLADTEKTSVDAFKATLEGFRTITGGSKVTPNNPNVTPPDKPSITNADGVVEAEVKGSKFDEIAASMPGIASMMNPPRT